MHTVRMDGVDGRDGLRDRVVAELEALDARLYEAVAQADTSTIDGLLSGLSKAADKSLLWFGTAAVIGLVGGRAGRRAAINGIASIALASAVANIIGKQVTHRARPDRDDDLPADRTLSQEPPGGRPDLVDGAGDLPGRDRQALGDEQRLGVGFLDLHGRGGLRNASGSGARW